MAAVLFNQFDPTKQPKCKIELHVHLDGAVRLTTIWELAQKKGIDLHCHTFEELVEKCTITKPSSLADFLVPIVLVTPCFFGDLEAIERIAYEFCEDVARQDVLYAEVRYSPHLFFMHGDTSHYDDDITSKKVVETVNNGLKRGQEDFKVKVRSILCCIRGHPEWSQDVLDLAKEFAADGVVGIDIAGDESISFSDPKDIAVFKEAAALGIHRTAHAGEAGPASDVVIAMDDMLVERIGHGYHAVDCEEIYQKCLKSNIHFEVCPYSSFLTASVPLTTEKHPIIRLAEDKANFSINRDDPLMIQKTLDQEYSLLRQLGIRDVHITRANLNAARNAFLPQEEKEELISALNVIYGFETGNI